MRDIIAIRCLTDRDDQATVQVVKGSELLNNLAGFAASSLMARKLVLNR